jgi:hypothetical protein
VAAVDHHAEFAVGEIAPHELRGAVFDGEDLEGRETGEGEGRGHDQLSAFADAFLSNRGRG